MSGPLNSEGGEAFHGGISSALSLTSRTILDHKNLKSNNTLLHLLQTSWMAVCVEQRELRLPNARRNISTKSSLGILPIVGAMVVVKINLI